MHDTHVHVRDCFKMPRSRSPASRAAHSPPQNVYKRPRPILGGHADSITADARTPTSSNCWHLLASHVSKSRQGVDVDNTHCNKHLSHADSTPRTNTHALNSTPRTNTHTLKDSESRGHVQAFSQPFDRVISLQHPHRRKDLISFESAFGLL